MRQNIGIFIFVYYVIMLAVTVMYSFLQTTWETRREISESRKQSDLRKS
jgi:hypothetical protein